jgi:hypothetical protein
VRLETRGAAPLETHLLLKGLPLGEAGEDYVMLFRVFKHGALGEVSPFFALGGGEGEGTLD